LGFNRSIVIHVSGPCAATFRLEIRAARSAVIAFLQHANRREVAETANPNFVPQSGRLTHDEGENATQARMVVVLNWHEELKRLPPN
jgi:hypothetical protein